MQQAGNGRLVTSGKACGKREIAKYRGSAKNARNRRYRDAWEDGLSLRGMFVKKCVSRYWKNGEARCTENGARGSHIRSSTTFAWK